VLRQGGAGGAGARVSVLVDRGRGRVAAADAPAAAPAPAASPLAPALAQARALVAYVLPAGFPATVAPSYARYALLAFCASAASAAGGVLATQSLLAAVGVGSAAAVPAAAALNWVLKDGIGQAGGVAYAALVGNRFDADPKRWRLVSALVLDAATCLELATPLLAPLHAGLFLPVAAAANFGKNVAWLSASASRAGLHQALAARGNLADLTAKAGSQTIAASALGTALGVALSAAVGPAPSDIAAAFALLSALHLAGVAGSLRGVALPTLSAARIDLAADHLVRAGAGGAAVDGADGAAVDGADGAAGAAPRSPAEVAALEGFLPWQRPAQGRVRVSVGGDARRLADLARCAEVCATFGAGAPPAAPGELPAPGEMPALGAPPAPGPSHYVLGFCADAARGGREELLLLLLEEATWRDVLLGYLHAMRLRAVREGAAGSAAPALEAQQAADLAASRVWVERHGAGLIGALDAAGWWVGTPLLDLTPERRLKTE